MGEKIRQILFKKYDIPENVGLGVLVAGYFAYFMISIGVFPQFILMFDEMGMQFTGIRAVLLSVPGWVYGIIFLLIGVGLILARIKVKDTKIRHRIYRFAILFLLFIIMFTPILLFPPLPLGRGW